MKKITFFIAMGCILLCIGCKSSKFEYNHFVSDVDSLYISRINELQAQINEMRALIKRLNDNFGTLVQDIYVDSLSFKEVRLSQGYTVCFIPLREYVDGNLSIYYSYLLKGDRMKKILEGWFRTDEIIDIKDYFILFGMQGKPREFFLYEKKTGMLLLHASSLKVNFEKEAIIYQDYPEGDNNFYIFDLTTQYKIQLKLPDNEKYQWTKYGNAYESVFIKDKRNEYFILGSTEDENCEWIQK